ncbi:MAG: flavodoxin family protein [Methanobacteriaceae archaeon]|nr:flavodoxin family protein [Methanobacteriaceae archaeon]
MHVLAVVGSPRKGKATDKLVDKAISGVKFKNPDCEVQKIHLTDYDINYCRNCLVCRDTVTDQPQARCTIRDDMDKINDYILKSDALIMGTPVHSSFVTAPMATFLERIVWVFAKPEGKILNLKGLPKPRTDKKRKLAIIVVSGGVPPILRRFCDNATHHINDVLNCSLNTKKVGDMYAGDVENRGVELYMEKAYNLGKKLLS